MRKGVTRLREQGSALWGPLFETMLAEIEGEAGQIDAALATIDQVTSESARTAQRWFEAETHRIRGEILLKQNPAAPAPAEAAFLAAITVAQHQKARSFELRAALSLAKLYQSTGRPIDAYDVLAPALEGFAPTPEFSEVAEAKALFEATGEQS
jgi:predicted ATPase